MKGLTGHEKNTANQYNLVATTTEFKEEEIESGNENLNFFFRGVTFDISLRDFVAASCLSEHEKVSIDLKLMKTSFRPTFNRYH